MNPSTILVTGGAGFIGSHLVKRLVTEGHRVIIVDNFNEYYDPKLKRDRIKHILNESPHVLEEVDIADYDKLKTVFQKHNIDYISHQAAQAGVRYSIEHPLIYGKTNLVGTLNILQLAREFSVKGLTIASSSSVYGDAKTFPLTECMASDELVSLYAATKRSTEIIARTYHHLYQIPITCLRYFTVYGPWGRPDMAIFKFTKAAFDQTPVDIFGHGDMGRDFTYIDDIVDGITRAIEKNHAWEIINLGRGKPERLMDFISSIETHTGKTIEKKMLPMQPGDVKETWADISHAKEKLGWEPTVQLYDGVKFFVDWYRDYYTI
jgi:UDP-glucuronate 4-epimerase